MPKINVFLLNEYRNAYGLTAKKKYSIPKIYDANGDLSKRWYVHFSFRNPQNGLLVKQTPIYGGANTFKTKQERYEILNSYRKSLLEYLEKGLSPYGDNTIIPIEVQEAVIVSEILVVEEIKTTISEAFTLGITIKESLLSKTSLPGFKSNVKRFEKWLNENGFEKQTIEKISKKTVINYLNTVLANTTPRTRNNTRIDLGSLFQTLEDNEVIVENFIKKINVLKAVPERNKTYTQAAQNDIFKYMEENDSNLLLFVKFISYNFLRPIEVCRLRIGDLNLVDNTLIVDAKNGKGKTKIIPEIILKELPDLSNMNKNNFLFTADGIGGEWEATEVNKRDSFTNRFKKVKDHFGLGKDYGLYSFRHTFITKLYNQYLKTMAPYEAKTKLMLVTGHKTIDALEFYLRDIDAVLPEDYSHLLE